MPTPHESSYSEPPGQFDLAVLLQSRHMRVARIYKVVIRQIVAFEEGEKRNERKQAGITSAFLVQSASAVWRRGMAWPEGTCSIACSCVTLGRGWDGASCGWYFFLCV